MRCAFFVSQRNFIDMLNKAPRLKSTIKTKAKGNINVRPASEAMVGYRFVRSWPVDERRQITAGFCSCVLRSNCWHCCSWTAWLKRRRPKRLRRNLRRSELSTSGQSPRSVYVHSTTLTTQSFNQPVIRDLLFISKPLDNLLTNFFPFWRGLDWITDI